MAEETRTINLEIKNNANSTVKDFKKLADSASDLKTKTKEAGEGTKEVAEGAEEGATGFKKLGVALKAAGIGLVVAAFAKFSEVLNENQKVADFFNTTFEALSLAFNDFFNFVSDNVGSVVNSFKAIFDDPLQSIKNLGNAIKNNIIERFNSAIESIGFLGDAIVKVFSGDFEGAAESAKNAGKEFIDTLTGVDDTFDKTVETVGKVVEATTNYVTETVKAAKSNVDLAKSAEIARVRQQGLVEEYDRQAERLRQVRDVETNTIQERIEANEKLGQVLDEQEKAMLKQVDLQIASARAELNKNKNQENTIALLEAQNEKAAVLAQIDGLRSEQITNQDALIREQIELTNSQAESEANLGIERKRINAEQIEDDLARLKRQQEIDAEEKEIQTARLQRVIDQAKDGTQAKIDAQIALDEFEVEAERKRLERAREIAEKEKEIATDVAEKKKELDAKEIATNKEVLDKRLQMTNEAFSALSGLVTALAGENEESQKKAFKINKAINLAQAVINTAGAISAAINPAVGGLGIPAGLPGAAIAAATGIAQVATIAKTKFEGGGASSGVEAPATSVEAQAPQFNVVGDSGVNQLAELQQQPTQAFVVSGEVTTAQALDRNRVQNATL